MHQLLGVLRAQDDDGQAGDTGPADAKGSAVRAPQPGLEVVAEADDGAAAVTASYAHRPDVLLMDIEMPGTDGLEATRRILADPRLSSRVLILTTFGRDDNVFEALRLGASGFLLKTAPPEDLIVAVRTVAAGDAVMSPSVTRRVVREFARLRHPVLPGGGMDGAA